MCIKTEKNQYPPRGEITNLLHIDPGKKFRRLRITGRYRAFLANGNMYTVGSRNQW